MSRHRDYCFTIYNEDCDGLSSQLQESCDGNSTVKYCIVGLELCPDTKREHLQGYISFKYPKTGTALQKFTKGGKHHFEVRRGSAVEARNYCWKGPGKKRTKEPHPDADWWETGILPIGKGARTDIMKTKESLENGASMRDIIRETTSGQSLQYAKQWLTYEEKPRNYKPKVEWYYGLTGTGKSKLAFKTFEGKDYFVANETNKWWDGYDGHQNIIIDDMRSNFATYHCLLRLLDRYEHKIEYKGGFRQFKGKHIIITSSETPEEMFHWEVSELMRRITKLIEFKKVYVFEGLDMYTTKLHKG